MISTIKKAITGPADWLLYTVLNEKQRKTLLNLLTDEQKKKIKQRLMGRKQEQRQQLKQIKYHLYNLGFTERALAELTYFFENIKDPQLRRLAAWELTLWHANQLTEADAKKALEYSEAAAHGEKEANQLRRIAIIRAELYETCNELDKAKHVIDEMLKRQQHADLYLAAANLENDIAERVKWINRAMTNYTLQPIEFASEDRKPEYDDLRTLDMNRKIVEGPKVSVILPAFKAEGGIRVAIESILSQTWTNLELLAVDDCSPDQTAAVIREYAEKDSRVKLLSTPVNSGPYVARNIALQKASGEFVTINDSDDWSHAEKLEIQVNHLIKNEHVIANTSEHARLTEDLKLYRRGTPGKYIFPNMSSIMFRREPVLEKVGYWDSVRFAADGEFKRRLINVFGKNSYVDLKSGPLSLPRQSVTSLTGSSAFGYNGFFMGVRKEYVESLEYHHQTAQSLRYPFPMESRPFHVPEPMWPNREAKPSGSRIFNIVIATDFRTIDTDEKKMIHELYLKKDCRIGFVQLNQYHLNAEKEIKRDIRQLLDGDRVQMLVYGEKIQTDRLIVINPTVLEEHQRYIPEVKADAVHVVISRLPANMQESQRNLKDYFNHEGEWFPATRDVKQSISESHLSVKDEVSYHDHVWEPGMAYDE
ncbi:glycosyltransferase family 2 protein [Oceanobacillus saliphilus]|uniref:glycosyltransferase family 2 protein n=1 Tax=Oceanobacillus saliphilus TaxID=2925834 RepID=UPI00201DD21A|nr:glycosyltransferase family 2 protein [Oceanobacillus saliphilus]